MNQYLRSITGLAVAAALAIAQIAQVSSEQAPPVNVPGVDKPVIVVTGEINGAETWVNTNYYVLRGAVFVRLGATLTIQAGTKPKASAATDATTAAAASSRQSGVKSRCAGISVCVANSRALPTPSATPPSAPSAARIVLSTIS